MTIITTGERYWWYSAAAAADDYDDDETGNCGGDEIYNCATDDESYDFWNHYVAFSF